MRTTRRQFTIAAASLMAIGPVGCASMSDDSAGQKKSLMDRMPWASNDAGAPEPYPNPVKVAATWTPDTLVQAGRTADSRIRRPVLLLRRKVATGSGRWDVDRARLRRHRDTPEDRVKRFEFTPEQFTRHFSQTDLGASYSVWVPWDAIGGDQRRISLVASFKTAEGKMVQGVPATIVLPGTNKRNARSTRRPISRRSTRNTRTLRQG